MLMIGKLPGGRAIGRCLQVAAALGGLAQQAHAQTQSGAGVRGCHATNGSAGSTIQGRNVPTFRAIAGQGWSPQRLQAFITTPHRPMPAIPLDMSEIRDVVAYILSLK